MLLLANLVVTSVALTSIRAIDFRALIVGVVNGHLMVLRMRRHALSV